MMNFRPPHSRGPVVLGTRAKHSARSALLLLAGLTLLAWSASLDLRGLADRQRLPSLQAQPQPATGELRPVTLHLPGDDLGLPAAWHDVLLKNSLLLLGVLATVQLYRRTARGRREAIELLETVGQNTSSMSWQWDFSDDQLTGPDRGHLSPRHAIHGAGRQYWAAEVHPDERDALLAALDAHRLGQRDTLDIEHRFRCPSGGWRWLLIRSHIIAYDRSGKPERAAGISIDVSARKRTEAALEASRVRSQATLASIADAVISTDAAGCIDYLNPMAEVLTGYPLSDARGQPLGQILHLREEFRDDSEDGDADDPLARCLEKNTPQQRDDCVLISRDQHEHAVRISAAPMRDRHGESLGMVLAICDTSRSRALQQRILHHASHDPLTGLANRHRFSHRLLRAIDSAQRHDSQHVLCLLDLDHFAQINQRAGQRAGDELLKQISGLLSQRLRDRDTLARLDGDHFALLLENCPQEKGQCIAQKILRELAEAPLHWNGQSFQITACIGLVPIDALTQGRRELLEQAEQTCRIAKQLGRNRLQLADRGGQSAPCQREISRVAELRAALDEDRFTLFGQPIVALAKNADEGRHIEVLLRLRGHDGELISPKYFVPAAERYELMPQIDRWVIRNALRHCREQKPEGAAPLELSINLSGASLSDPALLDDLLRELAQPLPAHCRLCFEITETAAISNLGSARRLIDEMHARGCRFALDDFGSGLSSFAYLKSLPVDYLKIDGSFIQQLDSNHIDRAMVAAIHQVGEIMGIPTVAEYVEREALIDDLREIGVNYGQGTALGAPQPLAELLEQSEPRPA